MGMAKKKGAPAGATARAHKDDHDEDFQRQVQEKNKLTLERWKAQSRHYSGHYDDRKRDNHGEQEIITGAVRRRAEYIAKQEVGDASEWGYYLEQAKGDVSDDNYQDWLKRRGWDLIETYNDYKNPEGQQLYVARRYHYRLMPSKKMFVLVHKEGERWVRGAGPVRVPFLLPEIQARADEEITLVEGEKGAIASAKAGLLATRVQGQNWTDDVAQCFAGRPVNVAMDNDDAGRDNQKTALYWLAKVNAIVRVPALPNLKPRQGLDDWLTTHSVEEYREIVAKTPIEGQINVEPHSFPEERTLERDDWLYGKHLLRGTVSGTAAFGGTGKSAKAIAEALAMASGRALLGVVPPRPLRVLLINLEDDRVRMNKRIAAAMKFYNLKPAVIGGRFTVIASGEYQLKIATQERAGVTVPDEAAIAALIKLITDQQFDVVSIDPLRRTHRVNENDNTAIGEVVECYGRLAAAARCAVHLYHHTRKSGGGEVSIESARGAIAFVDTCRSVNIMETMTKEQARGAGIEEQRHRFYFRTYNGKANFAPPVNQSDWFEFQSVRLDNAFPFGDDVVVVSSWTHPGSKMIELPPETIKAIRAAVGAEPRWKEHVLANMWVGKAIAPLIGLDVEAQKEQIKGVIGKLIGQDALTRLVARDPGRREEKMFVVAKG
jgi:hypothetical protein